MDKGFAVLLMVGWLLIGIAWGVIGVLWWQA